MRGSRRRAAGVLTLACLLGALGLSACAARRPVPPGPTLPEVRFIPPCDPKATIALSPEDEQALVTRDRLLQQRIRQLESMLREDP